MSAGQTVRVSYTVPEDDPVQDASGNPAGGLLNYRVNIVDDEPEDLPPDNPLWRTGHRMFEDNLNIYYNRSLKIVNVPKSAFTVTVDGEAIEVEDVDISGQVVTVLQASAPLTGRVVRVTYNVPTENAVQDTSGNRATARVRAQLIATSPVVTPPVVTTPLELTSYRYYDSHLSFFYNRSLKIVSLPEDAFTVTVDDEAVDFVVSVEGNFEPGSLAYADVGFHVRPAIGATIVVTYTKPSNAGSRIQDADGIEAPAFTVTVVRTNRAPYFAEEHDPGRRSFTETVGDAVVTTPANIGDRAAAFDVDYEHAFDLVYALEGTDAENFTLDNGTGQIRTKVGERYDQEVRAQYLVQVRARDLLGADATHRYIITVLDAAEPPLAPAAPVVVAVPGSMTSLDVSWSAPSNAGRPDIESYDLQYSPGMDGPWTDGPQGVTGTSASIGSLMPGPPYYVRVRATNADGDGDWSLPRSGMTNRPPNLAPAFAAGSAARSFTETVGDRAGHDAVEPRRPVSGDRP